MNRPEFIGGLVDRVRPRFRP